MAKGSARTWKRVFWASPGPASLKEAVILITKGLCMGSADVIPGVSGGTIALITGIYEELIHAIKSIDLQLIRRLLKLDVKGALAHIHIRFLGCLFLGIAIAVISLARLMHYLLHHHAVLTWSFFCGLIAASILIVGRQVKQWVGSAGFSFLAGTILAFFIVNLIPLQTPEDGWFIFLCGVLAICAMILPGISGAFILLILGKYEFITGTLKNPFLPQNFIIILVFACGCLVGLTGFSRILSYVLKKYHNLTLAFLTGLMTGALPKIWPWKEVIEIRIVSGQEKIIWGQNTWPAAVDIDFLIAVGLAIAGFTAVLIIENLSQTTTG